MKRLLLLTAMVLFAVTAWAQQTVTGTVIGEDGSPLEGVAVVVKGTTVGAFTDNQGNFALRIPGDANTLIFSLVGKGTEEIVLTEGQPEVRVTLQDDDLQLDEVVVTALGIAREERAITSAVQEVGGDALVQSRETNVVNALAGKVAGVQVTSSYGTPGAGSNITIRGFTSIANSDGQPLFVVDGQPINNSQVSNPGDPFSTLGGATFANRAVDINPEDIADITVLKGPAATALYGTRAANGVILIETKKGGTRSGGTHVSYNGQLTFEEVNKLPELNERYAQGFNGALSPNISTSWGPLISDLYYDGSDDPYSQNGALTTNVTDFPAQSSDQYEYFQTGVRFDNNFTLSGGDMSTNYILSVSNTDHTGVVPNSAFNRTTVRANGSTPLGEKLSVSSSLNYTYSKTNAIQQGSNVNGVALGLFRTPPSFDNSLGFDEVDPSDDPASARAYLNPDGTQRNYRGGGGYDNPYWASYQNPMDQTVNRFFGNATLTYDPTDWLKVTARVGGDNWSDFRKQRFALNSSGGFADGQVYEQASRYFEFNSDVFATAMHDFNEDFSMTFLLGSNLNHRFNQTVYTQGDGLSIPEYYNLNSASTISSIEFQNTRRLAGVYSRLQLDYARMLYLELSARNDWASTFGEEDRDFFYPSASLGFVFTEAFGVSEEDPVFSFGKIRLSYAQAGIEPPPYQTLTYYAPVNPNNFIGGGFISGVWGPYNGRALYTRSTQIGNPLLQPELTTSYEGGVDLRFFQGRVNLDFTYYYQVSSDQLLSRSVPTSSGYFTQYGNFGEMENRGIEIVFDVTPVKTRDFSWNLVANFTRNRNEITALTENSDFISIPPNFASISTRAIIGEPYGSFWGGQFLRTSDGRFVVDANGYPVVDSNDGLIGDPNPDFILGVNNTFRYKGLSFNFLVDWREGGDVWNGTKGALYYFGAHKDTDDNRFNEVTEVFDGVTAASFEGNEDNPSAWETNTQEVPLDINWHLGGPGSGFTGPSEQFIEDGGWIRLREVTLSYALPKDVLDSSPFGNAELSFTGRNVLLITDYTGIDPETSLTGAGPGQGWDYFNMPNTRSYTVALRLSF